MKKSTYNSFRKVFDGLKMANLASMKLPGVNRPALDLAMLIATREALKEWDEGQVKHENFFEMLTARLAEANYDIAEVIAKREGIEQ